MYNLKVLLVVMVMLMASSAVFAGLPDGSVNYGKTTFSVGDTVAVIHIPADKTYAYYDDMKVMRKMVEPEYFTKGIVDFGTVKYIYRTGKIKVCFNLDAYPVKSEILQQRLERAGGKMLNFELSEARQRVVVYNDPSANTAQR
jgi:hypothetical protein